MGIFFNKKKRKFRGRIIRNWGVATILFSFLFYLLARLWVSTPTCLMNTTPVPDKTKKRQPVNTTTHTSVWTCSLSQWAKTDKWPLNKYINKVFRCLGSNSGFSPSVFILFNYKLQIKLVEVLRAVYINISLKLWKFALEEFLKWTMCRDTDRKILEENLVCCIV